MNPITDYLDQPLSVGDRILYAVSYGSSGVGLEQAIIEQIEELVPLDPNNPECRYGYKYSERLKPTTARVELDLVVKWERYDVVRNGRRSRYVYDPHKLFKLKVRTFNRFTQQPADKPTWLKNVDRVVRIPESV